MRQQFTSEKNCQIEEQMCAPTMAILRAFDHW